MWIYGCTTKLLHPPVATLVLIVLNTIVYFVSASANEETVFPWLLHYGAGLHPLQWLTSIFLHADAMHLIGNMIFLWPFGLVVEGKIGWLRFLLLYLAIGVGQSAVEQSIMMSAQPASIDVSLFEAMPEWQELTEEDRAMVLDELRQLAAGASLGASSVIFGLLAVCCIWCPCSEFNIWWRFTSGAMRFCSSGLKLR